MYRSPESLSELLELGRQLRDPETQDQLLYIDAIEDLLHIRNRCGLRVPLVANKAQRHFEATRRDQNIVLKARQMGITTWVAARLFLKTITAPGVLTVQVAQTREAAESIFRMVQRFYEELPEPLRKQLRRSRNNVGHIAFRALDSEFRIVSASDRNAGRGLTMQNLHCSELGRWPGDAASILAGLRAALVPGGELVMESTPYGACGAFYEQWVAAPEHGVAQHFLPWWWEEAYVSAPATGLSEDELELMRLHGLTPAQIGFRRGLEQSYRGLRTQEFAEDPETCFRASGECCFELSAIEAQLAAVIPPLETRRNGTLQIWFPAQPGREYILGVDTAGGGADGDYSAIQVIDRDTGMQCAELRQHLTHLELARAAAALAREYNGALLAVERNNHGEAVLAYLETSARYRRIYEQEGRPGWLTSSSSKPRMVSDLNELLSSPHPVLRSRRLLQECRSFITHPGGRQGAAHGAHDDLVMAMAVAQAVRNEVLGAGLRRL